MFGQKVKKKLSNFPSNFTQNFKLSQVEEYEELRLDLLDLKSISQIQKTQINELTQKLNDLKPATWNLLNVVRSVLSKKVFVSGRW